MQNKLSFKIKKSVINFRILKRESAWHVHIQNNAKSLEAAIKLFGPASQQAGAAAIKLQKDFQSLVANGIDPASEGFKKMKASMPTSTGLDSTAGSLRKNKR